MYIGQNGLFTHTHTVHNGGTKERKKQSVVEEESFPHRHYIARTRSKSHNFDDQRRCRRIALSPFIMSLFLLSTRVFSMDRNTSLILCRTAFSSSTSDISCASDDFSLCELALQQGVGDQETIRRRPSPIDLSPKLAIQERNPLEWCIIQPFLIQFLCERQIRGCFFP